MQKAQNDNNTIADDNILVSLFEVFGIQYLLDGLGLEFAWKMV